MISFQPTDEELHAQEAFHQFARDLVKPAAAAIDRAGGVPPALLDRIWDAGIIQSSFDLEPSARRSRILGCIVLEELGWADASVALAAAASMSYVQAIMDMGTIEQQQQMRATFDQPGFRSAVLLIQEPGFAAHVGALKTTAVASDRGYVIDGVKAFLPLPQSCEDFLVVARSGDRNQAFLVPADAPGIDIRPAHGTLGLKGVACANVHFSRVEVGTSARLGGDTGCDTSRLLASARTGIATILTGLSRAVFEHITDYTKGRIAHGTALARKQSVAFRLADMFIDIPSMRWMCWRAAVSLDKNRDARREARLAQIHCADCAVRIADEGVQLMGGHGYIRDNPVERWYRNACTLSLLEGIAAV